ncbi:S26 family signal peptidase [Niveispirillum cyanobacteriorum]|uniref:S26 family signal peptidase n=1 Tax=Niveispirillum cyanobacteriorum TaxID=1612173 RepID=A0A2K9NI17_9PROT|nr:S26 family signal peptidase [Niveispirillum cyanobacteriorum]
MSQQKSPRRPLCRRLSRASRRRALLLAGLALAALGFSVLARPKPILVWNSSASAPIGLYLVLPETRLRPGDLALVTPPDSLADLAARRGYLPRGVPLIKRVAAMGGDHVCAKGDVITINGDTVAVRQKADKAGRPLPWWQGCGVLSAGEILFLMPAAESLDGRYFGPLSSVHVIGRLVPLWLR